MSVADRKSQVVKGLWFACLALISVGCGGRQSVFELPLPVAGPIRLSPVPPRPTTAVFPTLVPSPTVDMRLTDGCTVTAPPPELGLHFFYKKYCVVYGIPIISSGAVPDEALQIAWKMASKMLEGREDIAAEMVSQRTKIGILGIFEVAIDFPEFKAAEEYIYLSGGKITARALGGDKSVRMMAVPEENLLCYPDDNYGKDNIVFVHEFAHTIKNLGLEFLDSDFKSYINAIYHDVRAKGLWDDTYSATNSSEYWAEGVMAYFYAKSDSTSPNGYDNFIHTREELKVYDPDLYGAIEKVFGDNNWRPSCPDN